jgi:hypothetical protein
MVYAYAIEKLRAMVELCDNNSSTAAVCSLDSGCSLDEDSCNAFREIYVDINTSIENIK